MMSQREVLIVLAHALNCPSCRSRLFNDPQAVFRGRALTDSEKEAITKLTNKDFITAELLARGSGTTAEQIRVYTDHAVVRLRHF